MPNRIFSDLFLDSLSKYSNDQKWLDSIFSGIKTIANTHVGNVGQSFIEKICRYYGYSIEIPIDRGQWDIKISNITFELKTATEDTNNSFQFNHIRYHRQYQAVMCLGVSPNDLYFNFWSKADLLTEKAGRLVSMEKGANASYKLTKRKNDLYIIDEFDLRLSEFIENFK